MRHREWAEQIEECQNSGKGVVKWCKENGINPHTYYSRLKIIRKETLSKHSELQEIVPVSVSSVIAINHNEANKTESVKIRKNGMEIDVPETISEKCFKCCYVD